MKIVVLTIFFILSLTSVFCQTIDCNSNNPLLTPSESDIMNIIFRNGNIDFDFVNKKMSFANLQNDVMYFSSIRKACYNYYLSNKKSFLRNMDTTKTNFRNSYKLILLSETEKNSLGGIDAIVVKLENQKIIFTEKFRELAIESFTKVYYSAAINLFDLGLDSGIILTDLEIKYFNSQFGKDSISYQF